MAKKNQPTKNAEKFTVELKTGDKTYKSTGKTISEAFDALTPVDVKTKSVLKIKKGNIEFDKMMSVSQMRRFFNNNVSRLTLSKYFHTGF